MIKETALRYLGYVDGDIPTYIEQIIDDCLKEIEALASFKHVYQIYDIEHSSLCIKGTFISIDYPSLSKLLENCHSCILEACTLGSEIDRKLQYYSKIDATKMTIFDAVASSYLEYKANQQDTQYRLPHTFRFCPGYGEVPLSLNSQISKALDTYKNIGVMVQESGLLLPQKSMLGIIGLGSSYHQKDCSTCIKNKDCSFIRRGKTCYQNN
jgi:hypothetical protein